MAEVSLRGISKFFGAHKPHSAGRVVGLKDFTLTAGDSEFVTILGPSGSGKSTALRIIAGLERQDEGSVFIGGNNVDNLMPQDRDVAFVFQSYALYPHMSVYDNIAVGLRLKGHGESEIRKRVSDAADMLEIGQLLKRRPRALSGGQRQRVALARAIAKRPKAFLLDEPLSNLDAILRERMRAELKGLFKRLNATVLYVTHDQTEAASLSDRIALIDKGILRQAGSFDELYYNPKNLFVASFMGSPRINIFEAAIDEGCFILGPLRLKIPDIFLPKIGWMRSVIFGIRPEDVSLYPAPAPNAFEGTIIGIEKMGKYATLNIKWQGQVIRAVAESDARKQLEGERVWLGFNMKGAYLFDSKTQRLAAR